MKYRFVAKIPSNFIILILTNINFNINTKINKLNGLNLLENLESGLNFFKAAPGTEICACL